jgi:glycosyltransferase involved in cell wall biosynthesis
MKYMDNYFSVVVPLYNKGNSILKCLDSIFNQSYDKFEVILVNDGSTDDSISKIINYQNITIINQANMGVSIARNNGVLSSKYQYIAFLDADDEWMPDYLYNLNKLINKCPNAKLYGINYYTRINDKIEYVEFLNDSRESYLYLDNYFELFTKHKISPFSNSSCCFEKNAFLDMGGYSPGVKLTEDSELWSKFALKHKIGYCKLPLAVYNLNSENNTISSIESNKYKVIITLEEYLEDGITDKNIKIAVKKMIALQYLNLVRRGVLTRNKINVIKFMLKKDIAIYYTLDYIVTLFSIIVPVYIIEYYRKKFKL